ncbi:MAG: primosomal protein N' [Simkaniaceae bacterium]|nr:primosomal protein N' [Candidatus Sacchlamyda saccharinae]
MPIAEVVLDTTLEKTLDYSIPKELGTLRVGMRVEVPLRGRSAKGTILALKEKSAFQTLKPLLRALGEEAYLGEDLFALAQWMSKYYTAPLSKVLKVFLPPSVRDEDQKHKTQSFVRPLKSKGEMKTLCESLRGKFPAQAKVLDYFLMHPKGALLTELLEHASKSPIQTLCKKGVLKQEEVQIDRSPIFAHEFFPTKPKTLNAEQKQAFDAIVESAGQFAPHLLFGITGSGKTEVYLQVIEKTLAKDQSIIYLVPEIALTSQTIERFKGRFGGQNIAILHHRLSSGERFDTWHKIRSGTAKIIIGARSAIFCPAKNLGLIIVDEEHESSFKQTEETPKYHARDVAVMRAKLSSCPVILGTATPSLESYTNAKNGRYKLHCLSSRPDKALLPEVTIVDMKAEFDKAKGFTLFSDKLLEGIKQRYTKGEQILLFLNRRGYHTSAQCPACSHVENCPNCEITLTYHRSQGTLACHLCDFRKPTPRNCPSCHKDGPLKFKGAGTEMVERSLHAIFPDIRTLRLDADTTKHKGSHERIFKQFRAGKADILIGTQMIAKGLHFPLVTLVGVLGLDGSLSIPDFRASENVFQLLTQVAGRSGRSELKGEVLIQTHLPKHSIILHAANQDFSSFYEEEIEVRNLFSFPPFSHLVKFSFASENVHNCEKTAIQFREDLIKQMPEEVELMPVIPCGYAKINGKYRFQFLIKSKKLQKILPTIQRMRGQYNHKGVRLSIDVDPLTTYF